MKILALVLLGLLAIAYVPQDANQAVGDWNGSISLPGGQSLKVVFHVKNNNGALTATMDSPNQQAYGIKMDKASFTNGVLELTLNQIQGTYKGTLVAGKFEGTWTQSGQSFTLNLEKGSN